MKRRRITLADGRYLIFYTFEDESTPHDSRDEEGARQPGPEPAQPEMKREEQPHV
jgi:hypothetical protein